MAEFCLDCWNRINETSFTDQDFVISKDYDLCEGCGEIKHVIELYRKPSIIDKIRKKLRK